MSEVRVRDGFHDAYSVRWQGHPRRYQAEARQVFATYFQRPIRPWSWVTTECLLEDCLDPNCMIVREPKRIEYPSGICIYCGAPGYTRDHLLPEPLTGITLRGSVPVVPACGSCNNRIGDFPSANVSERRRRAQLSIERTNKGLLLRPHRGPEELAKLGRMLQSIAVKNNHLRIEVLRRLSWPSDPMYDVRAFQKSGMDDPVALGMCDGYAKPLRPEYAAAAAMHDLSGTAGRENGEQGDA